MDEKSLSHTKWVCQYHIVICPKYRRKAIYGKLRKDIGKILRRLCEYKKVEIIEAHAMPDHIHIWTESVLDKRILCKHRRRKQESDREIHPGAEDQICDQLSFKEYENPFKDVKTLMMTRRKYRMKI